VADGNKHAGDRNVFVFVRFQVFNPDFGDAFRIVAADNVVDHAVPLNDDFRVAFDAFLQNLVRPQFVAAVNQRDAARDAGQIKRFFRRRIAAADNRHVLVAVKEAVAGRTAGNAEAAELFLVFQSQPAGRSAGGNDYAFRPVGIGPFGNQHKRTGGKIDLRNLVVDNLHADVDRLVMHSLHQFAAVDRFGKAGKVFHVGGDRQLSAFLQPADQYRTHSRPRGINARGIAGRTGSDNQHFGFIFSHFLLLDLFYP